MNFPYVSFLMVFPINITPIPIFDIIWSIIRNYVFLVFSVRFRIYHFNIGFKVLSINSFYFKVFDIMPFVINANF